MIIEDYFSEQKEPSFIIHSAMDGDEGMERIYEREYDFASGNREGISWDGSGRSCNGALYRTGVRTFDRASASGNRSRSSL